MINAHTKWNPGSDEVRKHFGYVVHDLARQLRRHFETAAQHYELTLPQWRAIGQLSLTNGVSQVELAALCDTDPMTISGVVERLESKGLVRREADPDDSRAKIVMITDKARAMVQEMKELAEEVYVQAFDGIDEHERATTLRVLNKMSANLSGQRAPSKEELV